MHTKDIVSMNLIGKSIEITKSKNKSLIGVKGKVIDETKNMIILDNQKKLIKSQSTFKIKIKNNTYEINGKVLQTRPEDRIKK